MIDFGDTVTREVVVPPNMVTIPATATVGDAMGKAVDAGLSRLPVLEPTIDEIAGVAYARDLLRGVHDERGGGPVRRLLRPAYFVPETNASHELLAEMQVGHSTWRWWWTTTARLPGWSPSRT